MRTADYREAAVPMLGELTLGAVDCLADAQLYHVTQNGRDRVFSACHATV